MCQLILFLLSLTGISMTTSSRHPTIIFHGINDSCTNIQRFTNTVQQSQPTTYTVCLETGANLQAVLSTSITSMAQLGCSLVKSNHQLKNKTINVIGQSQGALIARYILQKCDFGGSVHTLITLGGPNQGVAGIPECSTQNTFCRYLDYFLGASLVYTSFVQAMIGPAGYYKDQYNQQAYLEAKTYLAKLNNEVDFDQKQKDRFEGLSKLVLILFSEDTTVIPKESAWFQFMEDNSERLLTMEDTKLYKQDLIGLKKLNEQKKIIKETIYNKHMHVHTGDIWNTVIPYLI